MLTKEELEKPRFLFDINSFELFTFEGSKQTHHARANLERFGSENYYIYDNGKIFNTHTRRFVEPDVNNNVTLLNAKTGTHHKNSYRKLMNQCFSSPQVTDDVRYKNLDNLNCYNHCITEDGRVWGPAGYLTGNKDPRGYAQVVMLDKNSKRIYARIHRLVAEAFIENDDTINKTEVNHIDGDKLNNHYTNLEWVTPKENDLHARIIGLKFIKFESEKEKLKNLIKSIKYDLYNNNTDPAKICKYWGISKGTLDYISKSKNSE